MGGSHLLMQALGSSAKVNEILLTGKVLSGEEAYDLGIVNQLADDAKAEAYALAKEVARQNPLAV
jgi:enoyl-CoA hydratase/carnithine racemase